MMDRALKERIIGAIVLVLVVVLVVPVFLDGPSGDADIVNERVPLPGQSEQETKTIVLDRDRSNPVPSSSVGESAQSAPETKQVVVEQVPQAKPVEAKPEPVATTPEPQQQVSQMPPQAASLTGMWAVQLGSFGNKENAERLAADLRKQGFAAFLSQLATSDGPLHRVRIGPQKDRESAEAMAARLSKVGHKGKVLPHP
jgi:DedD protein